MTYHRVSLNGRQFEAAWAGRGRIALWGADGLGAIDTRTWTTKAIAPAAAQVVATPSGIAVWGGGETGLRVYQADGTLRFVTLGKQTIRDAEAVGRYLYVRADQRYAVDLAGGRVVGRVRDDARLARPSATPLP